MPECNFISVSGEPSAIFSEEEIEKINNLKTYALKAENFISLSNDSEIVVDYNELTPLSDDYGIELSRGVSVYFTIDVLPNGKIYHLSIAGPLPIAQRLLVLFMPPGDIQIIPTKGSLHFIRAYNMD